MQQKDKEGLLKKILGMASGSTDKSIL